MVNPSTAENSAADWFHTRYKIYNEQENANG
jgi:hypothetical protein